MSPKYSFALGASIICLVLMRCATSEEKPNEVIEPARPAYYTLRSENVQNNPYPLPIETAVLVDWKFTDGSIHSGNGFRAWDIDHDGRFDALEVLDPEGKTVRWAFDFDNDGRIDATKEVESDDVNRK